MVDGPSTGPLSTPKWDKVGVDVEIRNRLEVPISWIELEIGLVRARRPADDAHAPIAGWTFRETVGTEVEAGENARLRITKPLAARRVSPKADEIAYRIHLVSYRLMPPSPDVAMRLLQSTHESDQRAALKSYEEVDGLTGRERSVVRAELALELDRFRSVERTQRTSNPGPSMAFRLLFVIRSMGALKDAANVETLLGLPDDLSRQAWGRAIAELSTRLARATAPMGKDVRSEILPTWTRDPVIAAVRSADALEEATDRAILQMGDAAVPALLEVVYRANPNPNPNPSPSPSPSPKPNRRPRLSQTALESSGSRHRALRLLHMLGRSTPRSQLALKDLDARLRIIDVLGSASSRDAIDALIEGLSDRTASVRARTRAALVQIGPPAARALVERLGQTGHEDRGFIEILLGMDSRTDAVLEALAVERQVAVPSGSPRMLWLERLEADARQRHEREVAATIERALELERRGELAKAIAAVDPLVDMLIARESKIADGAVPNGAVPKRTVPEEAGASRTVTSVAELYRKHGAQLLDQGNFDAASAALERSLNIYPTARARGLFVKAMLSLAHGYQALDELDRAEHTLDLLLRSASIDEADRKAVGELQAALLARRADQAMDRGDYSRARKLLDKAHTRPRSGEPAFLSSERRLFVMENLATVIILALLVGAVALALLLALLSRASSRKVHDIQHTLDEGGTH
ncbi:MAG: HEAT repeat domain-containing protein [Deltaproteobacteria bacterium]|nr:HEAT repeat domain-containing protein [Deltaproteobacteria bacterium]